MIAIYIFIQLHYKGALGTVIDYCLYYTLDEIWFMDTNAQLLCLLLVVCNCEYALEYMTNAFQWVEHFCSS